MDGSIYDSISLAPFFSNLHALEYWEVIIFVNEINVAKISALNTLAHDEGFKLTIVALCSQVSILILAFFLLLRLILLTLVGMIQQQF